MTSLVSPLLTHGERLRALGERVKSLRKRRKLSRVELSARSGVSESTIKRLEGEGVATVSVLLKVAEALGALETLSELFAVETFESLEEFARSEKGRRR